MSKTQKGTSSLRGGRKQTDESLSTERAKTDESLLGSRAKAERSSDKASAERRSGADETRASTRREDDGALSRQGPAKTAAAERVHSDERVRQERIASDEAIREERGKSDAATGRERKLQAAIEQKLLRTERMKTDQDLSHERNETDAEVQRMNDVLTKELSAHGSTRKALTTRDEFLSIVSHDLRNPIGAIAAAADLLTDMPVYAQADEDGREYIDMIARNANEALRLISDLMDMEHLAVGRLGLELELCDISEVIRQSVMGLVPLSIAKGLKLRIGQNGHVSVKCDRGRIAQVLSNLIGNALKFTPSGGLITVTTEQTAGELRISVLDSGPGIPSDMRKTIFQRFWQIEKHDCRGLGLGLYISAVIVDAHGGRIWVDPEVGEGSAFHFTLPA